MNKFLCLLAGAALGVAAMGVSSARADVVIADQGKSNFSIIVNAKAPKSVQAAAQELQKDIELASGPTLKIVKDDVKLAGPFISLGQTTQASTAGLNTDGLGNGGYRILTKGGNLYILGPDTPDGKWTSDGGISSGTANGVYNFLKDQMGVRWLMPGDLGRVVPTHPMLKVPDIDLSYTPHFSDRGLSKPVAWIDRRHRDSGDLDWLDRQGVGDNNEQANVEHNHNWWRTLNRSADPDPLAGGSFSPDTPVVRTIYEKHSDWFAMDADGKRPYPKNHYAKLETTNQGLVKWFAQQALRYLKASKRPTTFSLSPSDGSATWSRSPESKALYDPPTPFNPAQPGVSSLVMKWYHDVAQIVAREYPQGRLSGYIYSTYFYPPTKLSMKLPSNFTPVIAASISYGYGMYRTDARQSFQQVIQEWAKVITGNWYYYDLPSQVLRQSPADMGEAGFSGGIGLIMPVAPENLNIIFHTLVENHSAGTKYIYGVPNWSSGAINNAVLAGMIWNPKADATDLRNDWLTHAYGEKAGRVMQQLYDKLNIWFRDYYRSNPVRYELTKGMLKDIFGNHYAEIESLYLQAMDQPMTDLQKQRLQLIGDNLTVLQWRLRNAGFLPAGTTPRLPADAVRVNTLLNKTVDSFEVFPLVLQGSIRGDIQVAFRRIAEIYKGMNVQAAPATTIEKDAAPEMDDNVLVIHATRDTQVRILPQEVVHDASFATYVVCPDYYDLTYPNMDARLAQGLLDPTLPITFSLKAGTTCYMYIPPRKARYRLKIENAAIAQASFNDKALTLYADPSPILVYHYAGAKGQMDVSQEDGAVLVANPSSNAAARGYLRSKYKSGRIDRNFDFGWRFSPDPENDGLERGVTQAGFNDTDWKIVTATNWWQMQGFADYHGPAWYRIQFDGPTLKTGETVQLYFGAIDGNATVYLNGKQVGQHHLGANYEGWNQAFTFDVTRVLKPGPNTLAVQVLSKDTTSASGIFKGVCLISGIRR